MRNPLTVTVITDTHYYSKKLGTSGTAYETANNKPLPREKGRDERMGNLWQPLYCGGLTGKKISIHST